MENTEKSVNKVTETLTKELEGMSNEGLRDFFMFFYKLNHQHYNMITPEKFEEFLEAFEKNPFKVNEDKAFRKQLIENIIKYAYYLPFLILSGTIAGIAVGTVGALLIKRVKF